MLRFVVLRPYDWYEHCCRMVLDSVESDPEAKSSKINLLNVQIERSNCLREILIRIKDMRRDECPEIIIS